MGSKWGIQAEPLEVGEKEEGWVLSPRLRAWLPPAGSEDGGAAWCNILSRHGIKNMALLG